MNKRFPNLTTYRNDETVNDEFQIKWVSPYYLNLVKDDNDWILQNEINRGKHNRRCNFKEYRRCRLEIAANRFLLRSHKELNSIGSIATNY